MTKTIQKEIGKDESKLKISNNSVKVLPANPDAYRKLTKLLKNMNANFHTYQLKQERPFRVVLRNIHHSVDLDELKFELQNLGHEVTNISNIKHRISKNPLSLFFIDIKQKGNNKEIYNVNRLMNSIVKFEPPLVEKEIVQCEKCQMYGHMQKYCNHNFRCVKCAGSHPTDQCTKSPETPAKCIHCQGEHPANYKGYSAYKTLHNNNTQHPSEKAHGGTGIIIKSSIKHNELPSFQKDYLQATSVAIEDHHGTITTSAVYCPPRHSIAKENFDSLFDALGNRFLAGGHYNAKHTQRGSRLVTARGKNLLKSITTNNLNYLTTYEPTYWPTDTNKIPDLLDFFITKNISPRHVQINSSAELFSGHSPVIATVGSAIIENPPNGLIHNQLTNWQLFREIFNRSTSASISLKTKADIETATEYLNTSIINAIRSLTPTKTSISKHEYPH